jgi:hypothetical protein
MGYWKQKMLDGQHQEWIEKLVKDYLESLFLFVEELVYNVYEENGFVIVDFDRKSVKIVKSEIELVDRTKLKLTYDELESEYSYYDQEEFDAIISQIEPIQKLNKSLINIQNLVEIYLGDTQLNNLLNHQSFISAIGSLEAYLSEKLIGKIFSDISFKKKFVLSHPDFKSMKFKLSEIYDKYETLDKTIKKILLDQIYHNLPVVSNMYKDALNIKFPNIQVLMKSITIRHDLVHRNGRTKDGDEIIISKSDVKELCEKIKTFAEQIEEEIEK